MKPTLIALLSTGAFCAFIFATPAAAQTAGNSNTSAGPVNAAGALVAAPFKAAGDIVGGLTRAPAYAPGYAPAAPVVPIAPFAAMPRGQCSVLHDWNGRRTAVCGP